MNKKDFPRGIRSTSPTHTTILIQDDSMRWLDKCEPATFHGIVTDPPYGVREFEEEHLENLAEGDEVWQTFRYKDGANRAVQPCFSTLSVGERKELEEYFQDFGRRIARVLKPGAHAIIAGHVSLSNIVFPAIERGAILDGVPSLEFRGSIIRLVTTLRGGDRPPGYQKEFPDVCTLPRSRHEPWALFRKAMPAGMSVVECLREHGTGALRRQPSTVKNPDGLPAMDVIAANRPTKDERAIANHPNLKPQSLMRELVYMALPMGTGTILEPFTGSGSTLAAAAFHGLNCVGIEREDKFYDMAASAIPLLSQSCPKIVSSEEPGIAF